MAGLSFSIAESLGDGQQEKAVEPALTTTDWLQQVAPRAEQLGPATDDELMDHTHLDIQEAAAES